MTHFKSGHSNITIPVSTVSPSGTARKNSPWMIFSAAGCSLFLCVLALTISGLVVYSRVTWGDTKINVNLPVGIPQVVSTLPPPSAEAVVFLATETPANQASTDLTTPTATPAPYFGPICFRSITQNGIHSNCATAFSDDVVEIHAIFDYSHMAPQQHQWTRIWYHNKQEVLRVADGWSGDVSGQFDYNLNTSDGKPLSPGTWELELYANGQLQTYAAFQIEALQDDKPSSEPQQRQIAIQPPPINLYRLVFTRWDGSKHAIWTANLDGSDQQFLLDFAASPSWSPDGRWITFFGEEGIDTQETVSVGTNGVWVMDAEGQELHQLLPEGSAQTVHWSPDGNLIAFDAARGGPDRRIYFIGVDGGTAPFETLGEQASFSPDGNQVVVKVCRPECGLWISGRDDSNPRQLTTNGSDGLPAWSPDGSKIAFSREVDGNVDIYTITPAGEDLQRLTESPQIDSLPTWTPDNRRLVFRSTRNDTWQIFIMNSDGTDQKMIIDGVGASEQWAFDKMSIH